jgi:TM2 domain-containing membrane protein YozV
MEKYRSMEKVWEIKDPDALMKSMTTKRIRKQAPPRDEKDPAKAFTLSMLYWGGGQLYNDQIAKGAVFVITMVLLFVFTVLGATNSDELLKFLRESRVSLSDAFLYLEIALFLIILFWVVNAGDAYHHARRMRKTPFRGVSSRLTPLLGSLVLPGWGQFLNGQQLKGSFFSGLAVIGIFSVLSIVLTLLAWPLLDASDSRFLVEGIFAVCIIIVPFVPLLWLFGAYDALRVSLDDLKKEPVWERIKAAYYRCRSQGLVRGVVPHIKLTLMLVLFLVFSAIVVKHSFPRGFYADQLMHLRSHLSSQGMTIVPVLISRILELLTQYT